MDEYSMAHVDDDLDAVFGESDNGEDVEMAKAPENSDNGNFEMFEEEEETHSLSENETEKRPEDEDDEDRIPTSSRTSRRNKAAEEEEEIPEKVVKLRRLDAPRDAGLKPMLVKLPGFMGIATEEFTQSKVLEELGEFDDRSGHAVEENVAQANAYLRAATTIRWRKDPITKRLQTNARIVKWSDGSMSLMIGEELFELGMPSMAAEYNYIYGRHPEEGSMECLGRLKERIVIRPFITADQSHRKYSAAAAESSAKTTSDVRVKMAVTTVDPEKEKQRMIKLEQEKIKMRRKQEAKQRQQKQRSYERVSRTGLTARFLEDRDEEDDMEVDAEGREVNQDEYEDDFIDDTALGEGSEEEDEDATSAEGSDESEAAFSNDEAYRKSEKVSSHIYSTKKTRKTAIIEDDDE